jgi:site-specific recombinase XerD
MCCIIPSRLGNESNFLIQDNIILQYSLALVLGMWHHLGVVMSDQKFPQTGTKIPTAELIGLYVDYMRNERGLSEETIKRRIWCSKDFFRRLGEDYLLDQLDISHVDKILEKYTSNRYSRRTIQTYAAAIRAFFKYAEGRGWCLRGLAESIKAPRIYKHETLPSGPSWEDVQRLLKTTLGDHPTNIRDRAILMLLAIYGLRSGEVVKLRLDDLDWEKEILYVRRTKNAKSQEFPLSHTVGNAILRYLQKVRPSNCPYRELFIARIAPHCPLSTHAIYQVMNRRLRPLNVILKHSGPHALRHACATHLINEGISIKEISDYLGHQSLESTRIYAKVDLTNLRKVAEINLNDLL